MRPKNVTNLDPSITWLIFSLIGVPMYLYAAYIMKSKVFSYFAILGFVSLSSSLSSAMGLAMMWYFVFVMILGIIMDLVSLFGPVKKHPGLGNIPGFKQPVTFLYTFGLQD